MPSSRTARPWRWLVATVAVALLAAACGDDDDDEGATGGDTAATGAADTGETADTGDTAEGTTAPPDTGAPTTVSTLPPEDDAGEACGIGLLEEATEPVEIAFWHAMGSDNGTTLEEMTERYNQSQDRVHVTPSFQGTYDETLDKFRQALGGDLPEVVQLEETALQYGIDSGAMLPVQDCVDGSGYSFDDWLPPVVNEFRVEGQQWPMPFNTSTLVLYYDRAAFTAAGLDPDAPPTTLAELHDAAQAIVDSGYAQQGMSMILESWWVEQWVSTAGQDFVDGGNGREERSTELLLDNDVGTEIFSFFNDMIAAGLAANFGVVEDSDLGFLTAMLPGGGQSQVAMTITTSAILGPALALLGGEGFSVELEVAPLPVAGSGAGGATTSGAALWILEEDSDPVQRAAAWDFVQWLNAPEQQAEWHARTGYLPNTSTAAALPQVQDLWAVQPQYQVAYDQLFESSVGSAAGPVIGPYIEVRSAIEQALEDMVLSGLSPEDAVAQAVSGAADVMADYNDRVG
jgi:sn-glycerol 3-phosphate transport system substrate-binding protein